MNKFVMLNFVQVGKLIWKLWIESHLSLEVNYGFHCAHFFKKVTIITFSGTLSLRCYTKM